jgi:hypothetical protein
MKLDSTNRATLKAIAITVGLLFVIALLFSDRKSRYQPKNIDIEAVSQASLMSLKSSVDCLSDSVYSTSTGGVCGDQQLVRDHANYKIVG